MGNIFGSHSDQNDKEQADQIPSPFKKVTQAIKRGDRDAVKQLLNEKQFEINARDQKGRTLVSSFIHSS